MVHADTVQISLFKNINREKQAIERIKTYAPLAYEITGKPFYVAYSGGKDSDAIRILCELAGIEHDLVHNHTTVDAPETVYYVRSIPNIIIDYPETTMWKLIVKHRMPPTRIVRYCCSELKERGGKDRFVITGVRWAESVNRKNKRNSLEVQTPKGRDKIILNADNSEHRREFEVCVLQGKRVLNPIIDWNDNEVWDFLGYYNCKNNPLYQCGYKRVGCVGCPMARPKERLRQFAQYPEFQKNYIRAFNRMLENAKQLGKACRAWKTGQDVFDWWIADVIAGKPAKEQLSLFDT